MPLKKKFPNSIGIMGGSFNPFHAGHLNSLVSVQKAFSFEKILIVPAYQTPLSEVLMKESAKHRLNMVKEIVKQHSFMMLDSQEISRKGTSYTYRTVESIYKKYPKKELFFILGLDQFFIFDKWKEFKRLTEKANLIVLSRPSYSFPKSKKEFPEGLQKSIKSLAKNKVCLNSGRSIYFHSLKNKSISSSQVREQIKNEKSFKFLLPQSVFQYIKKNNLYRQGLEDIDIKKLLALCSKELELKKAFDINTFDLSHRSIPFSFGLIASSSNPQHCRSLSNYIKKRIYEEFKIHPLGQEGYGEGRWIVLDYSDLVIHIFYDYVRSSYNLEELWMLPSKTDLKS